MHDLVIRSGHVVDGSGAPARPADVAVDGDRIVSVGSVDGRGRRGSTPTAWSSPRASSTSTRTTTARPPGTRCSPEQLARRHDRGHGQLRRRLRTGAPRPARMADRAHGGCRGHPRHGAGRGHHGGTGRRSPSTSTQLDRLPRVLDVGAQVPHGAVRAYVMGERGGANAEAAPSDEIAGMAALVREAIEAGAVGFSTTRTIVHRAKDGELAAARSQRRTSWSASAGPWISRVPAGCRPGSPACSSWPATWSIPRPSSRG